MRLWWAFTVALFLLPLVGAQNTRQVAEPQELPGCGLPKPELFAHLPHAIENLAFDGNGSLYLTTFAGRLYRAYPDGTFHVVYEEKERTYPGNGPDNPKSLMGIDFGPDGSLFVSQGLAITGDAKGRVIRFPDPGNASFEVYAQGFEGVNGLAVAPGGDVFVVHGFRNQVWRITSKNTWSLWTEVTGGNGLVLAPDGKRLVLSQVSDAANRIVSVSLADPKDRKTVFFFNKGPSEEDPQAFDATRPVLLKGIDDIEVLPDGRIFGSAHLRGQVVMGDPAKNRACIAIDNVRPDPTSVRVAVGFGRWDGMIFSTDSSGDIVALDVGNVAPAANATTSPTSAPGASQERVPSVGLVLTLAAIVGAGLRRRD